MAAYWLGSVPRRVLGSQPCQKALTGGSVASSLRRDAWATNDIDLPSSEMPCHEVEVQRQRGVKQSYLYTPDGRYMPFEM
jgi:hypothetical protein